MALSPETKRIIRYTDLFIADFWRYLLKALWLFFPPIMFLAFAYAAFWHVVQGKDLMVITLEDLQDKNSFLVLGCFLLAMFFWTYVTWYSTRLVAKAKDMQVEDHHVMWKVFKEQTPRILSFTCITIIILAFFQLNNPRYPKLSQSLCNWILLASFPVYFMIYKFWRKKLSKKNKEHQRWLNYLLKIKYWIYAVIVTWIVVVMILKSFWALLSLFMGWQFLLVLLLMVRREIIEVKKEMGVLKVIHVDIKPPFKFWKKLWFIASDKEDRTFFLTFCLVSATAFWFYLKSVSEIKTAVDIGSFPFILLAFGVLLGIGNIITFISVVGRFNFHVIFYAWALILGHWKESHYVFLPDKTASLPAFNNRKNLKEYFLDWIRQPERNAILKQLDSSRHYPLYFVLANGGASRSGYWTASILSQLEDTTNGEFSKHLFCLSGASGGSVGNVTFFNLLRLKDKLKAADPGSRAMTNAARDYLSSDFLTYTLSHMLGPDIFRNIIPARNVKDRASALAYSLEKAPADSFLYNSFATPFSSIITQRDQPYDFPILCINTTRMQKGTPAVISNISLENDSSFNGRIDVLSLLNSDKDIKMSTAVVLGASFPYISPAGRIDHRDTSYYFVDGGYFDNSGAGVVNEMLICMNELLKTDPDFKDYRNKFNFYVIHISNTDRKKLNTGQINPITNDLFSPAMTLMSSYGSQTTVNDGRLKNYLSSLYKNGKHYSNVELYRNSSDSMKYSMNWVISKYQRNAMDANLVRNPDFKMVYDNMKAYFKYPADTAKKK